ncbi:MAG TPA: acyl-CoA dehydrogenase [Rhodobiaceae bacterium]|nr:MAG: Caffeyl-CoA reductase-Etf complex subunit CarC [Rhodobiaceae bacterium UBA7378]HCQ82859.1 acyl-CoA dehydrogenase [Rhodobiaceae bacterium]|tara:strand:+ start:63 stop:1202 length:1140 start_codon:yes stop_codon:yes gene_type:complete
MAFVLSEEQTMLRDMAKQFFSEQVPVTNLRKLRDDESDDGFDRDVWKQIVELGFAGILIPEDLGGTGFGPMGIGIVMQEAGRTLAASPLYSTAILGAGMIMAAGSESQKKDLLPQVAAGELLLALAIDEANHHNPLNIAMTATKDGGDFVLNGEKRFVIDGHTADKLIVAARTSGTSGDAQGISTFLVDADTAGVSITRTLMVDTRNAANIAFDNVKIPADALLGGLDAAYPELENVLDMGRVCLSAEMLGGIETVFDTTLTYLKERKQFDAIIGTFQALQHRAAEMFCEVEICQSVVLDALSALEERRNDIPRAASLAKARLSEASRLITNEGVQMHGGIGMTDAVDVGLFLKRARVQAQMLGDANFHRSRYADLGGY